jgi:hypothetical protein
LQTEGNRFEGSDENFQLTVIGPKAKHVPLDYGTRHYWLFRPIGPFFGERFTSRSISSKEPNLLNSLMGSLDPLHGLFVKPGLDEAGPSLASFNKMKFQFCMVFCSDINTVLGGRNDTRQTTDEQAYEGSISCKTSTICK